jgi:hypothetical protein
MVPILNGRDESIPTVSWREATKDSSILKCGNAEINKEPNKEDGY